MIKMKSKSEELREEIIKLIQSKNLDVTRFNITYTEAEANFKIEIKEKDTDALKKNFERLANSYGLYDDIYDKVVDYDGLKLKPYDIETRKRKTPIVVIDTKTGTKYNISESLAQKLYGKYEIEYNLTHRCMKCDAVMGFDEASQSLCKKCRGEE